MPSGSISARMLKPLYQFSSKCTALIKCGLGLSLICCLHPFQVIILWVNRSCPPVVLDSLYLHSQWLQCIFSFRMSHVLSGEGLVRHSTAMLTITAHPVTTKPGQVTAVYELSKTTVHQHRRGVLLVASTESECACQMQNQASLVHCLLDIGHPVWMIALQQLPGQHNPCITNKQFHDVVAYVYQQTNTAIVVMGFSFCCDFLFQLSTRREPPKSAWIHRMVLIAPIVTSGKGFSARALKAVHWVLPLDRVCHWRDILSPKCFGKLTNLLMKLFAIPHTNSKAWVVDLPQLLRHKLWTAALGDRTASWTPAQSEDKKLLFIVGNNAPPRTANNVVQLNCSQVELLLGCGVGEIASKAMR